MAQWPYPKYAPVYQLYWIYHFYLAKYLFGIFKPMTRLHHADQL